MTVMQLIQTTCRSPGWCYVVWRRSGLLNSKDGREVTKSILGIFEVERQPKDDIQGRLSIAVTASVEVPRSTLVASARVCASRWDTLGYKSALDPRTHDHGVYPGRVVNNEVGSADHVLEVVTRRLHTKVCEHSWNTTVSFLYCHKTNTKRENSVLWPRPRLNNNNNNNKNNNNNNTIIYYARIVMHQAWIGGVSPGGQMECVNC